MTYKAKIGLFFGGKSFEHEVSLRSMKSIVKALDNDKFEPILFPVTKLGKIYRAVNINVFENCLSVDDAIDNLIYSGIDAVGSCDLKCILSTMHGGYGENGSFQGLFEILQLPYVGCSVLGSSIAMDKDITKRLLLQAGLNVVPFRSLKNGHIDEDVLSSQGFPCFIKAASLGSSVGVYKCHNLQEAIDAAQCIFKIDAKLLVETAIAGREIEVAILGSEKIKVSLCGEIIPQHEFYSYEAKYLDVNGAKLEVPAKNIDHEFFKNIAIKACDALEINGMARIDFFVLEDGNYYINEINTLPGFTSISMYPKLFEASGITYMELISQLIVDAINSFNKTAKLQSVLSEKFAMQSSQ